MKQVTIYTDGACSGNPGPGGWGAILMYGAHKRELSGGEAATTNNRMELTAVIQALSLLKERRSQIQHFALTQAGADSLGMACGGQIGGVGLMKPMADAMYSAAVRMGKFLPMGARQSSRYRAFYKAIEGAGDRGVIEPARLAKETVLPADLLLTPLLDLWKSWGLVTEAGGVYRYTSSGRYWYRVMIRRMMHAADYMLFGKPDTKKKAHWGGMMNMR